MAATTYNVLFPEIESATIIGTGNVASWFVYALKKAKIQINQIYGRHLNKCKILAEKCGAEAIDDLSKLKKNSNLYIFSVNDDGYKDVVAQIPFELPTAVLTAGSVSQCVLAPITPRYGTIYPCQTISSTMDFSQVEVPLCIEGCDEQFENQLLHFANNLSDTVVRMNEQQRQQLHLAAVFACNFGNALNGVSFDILKNANINPQLLLPLLQNTLNKLKTMTPKEAQTGPAARGDKNVIAKHLGMIEDEKLREVYRLMSEIIQENQNK